MATAGFRFHGELTDFLPRTRAGGERSYRFTGKPSIKDAIEAQGVPHPEVEFLVVNDVVVRFEYHLQDGDRVAVYPAATPPETVPGGHRVLRPRLLEPIRFVLDVHLGKLARWLRLLGCDACYRNDYADAEIVAIAARDSRVVLTRDRRLLYHRRIVYGRYVRSVQPDRQVFEVLRRYRLATGLQPFRRCLECNGRIVPVTKAEVLDQLEPKTKRYYDVFSRCEDCRKIYWQGDHYTRLMKKVRDLAGS